MVVLGLLGSVTVPVPDTTVQVPTAGKVTGLPLSCAEVPSLVHRLWSLPAFAFGLLASNTCTLTASVVMPLAQGPLVTVQEKMLSPMARSKTTVLGSFGLAMVPVPLTRVHVPTAGKVTGLPCKVVVVTSAVHSS